MSIRHHNVRCSLLAVALTLCFTAPAAYADLLAYDGFSTTSDGSGDTYDADVTIRGATDPRLGFANPWDSEGGFASSIDFFPRTTGLTSLFPTTDPGRVELARTGGSSTEIKVLKRDLSYTFDGSDDIWVSFLVNYHFETPADPAPAFFNVILDDTDTGDFDFSLEIDVNGEATVNSSDDSASLGTLSQSPTTALDNSQTHMIVIRAQDSTAGPTAQHDKISVWLDPVELDMLDTPTAEIFGIFREQNAVNAVGAFDQLRLEGRTMPVGFRASLDEFRLGTLAEDVAAEQFVPEPSSPAFLALGMLAVRRRRRRRA